MQATSYEDVGDVDGKTEEVGEDAGVEDGQDLSRNVEELQEHGAWPQEGDRTWRLSWGASIMLDGNRGSLTLSHLLGDGLSGTSRLKWGCEQEQPGRFLHLRREGYFSPNSADTHRGSYGWSKAARREAGAKREEERRLDVESPRARGDCCQDSSPNFFGCLGTKRGFRGQSIS